MPEQDRTTTDGTSDAIGFDGQVVLVTGAARGIGRAHALLLARLGAALVINDVDEDALREVEKELQDAGAPVEIVVGDVVGTATQLVERALHRWDRLDAVVNNAGTVMTKPFADTELDELNALLRVHVLGTAAVTRAVLDALRASHGRIVNTTSGAVFGLAGASAYAMAKGAVLGLTRTLAIEMTNDHVRVNAIMPMARTRMFEQAGGVAGSSEDELLSERFPPDAVARVVAVLASNRCPTTGQVYEVAGNAVSRIAFASSPDVQLRTPSDLLAARNVLMHGALEEIHDLGHATTRKLASASRPTSTQ